PKSLPLPPGEGWGEGKRTSESIEKTGSDSSHPNPRPVSRPKGKGRLWDRLLIVQRRFYTFLLPNTGPVKPVPNGRARSN
ncbi:MAG TPA: hypothetical protein PL064_08060, partial [Thermogutta sp.]|nr:hypothetical protein [Thermogutta sp.]